MAQTDFQQLYRDTYSLLGFTLTEKDGIKSDRISAAEKNLGFPFPKALRQYYSVAGREPKLNRVFNRLIPIQKVEVHKGKIVFLEENQWAVVWGFHASPQAADDPEVFQGPIKNGEPYDWFLESKSTSAFLVFMLHLQAAYGEGMAFTKSAPAPADALASLDKDWRFAGEVNGMRAYGRQGQAVCITKWRNFGAKEASWRIFAGAGTPEDLAAIARDLNLRWD